MQLSDSWPPSCDKLAAAMRLGLRYRFLILQAAAVWLIAPSVAAAFSIISPRSDAVLRAGQEVPVSVDIGSEIGLRRAQYLWFRQGEEPVATQQATPALVATAASTPPFGGMLRVPVDAIGTLRLLAVGEVVRGRLEGREEFDEILVHVEPAAELSTIEFAVEKPWRLDTIGKIVDIPVVGQFADGVLRRIGGASAGSTYHSSDERVVRVFPEGWAQVVGNGRAAITVANRGRVGTLEVVVDGNSEPNQTPIARAGPDLTVKSGATVVLNGIQSTDPDGDPLRYEWKQIRGHKVTLFNVDEAKATFVAPKVSRRRLLQFRLRVTDMTGPDTVKGADSLPSVVSVWVEP